jgi:hypothetical protein
MDSNSDRLDAIYEGVPDEDLFVLVECARAWRHGNCGDGLLISFVDQFEAKFADLLSKEVSA